MKVYVQFLEHNLDGELVSSLGSDGVFILDGRNSIETMDHDAFNQLSRIRGLKPHIIGYQIMRGDFRKSEPVKYARYIIHE